MSASVKEMLEDALMLSHMDFAAYFQVIALGNAATGKKQTMEEIYKEWRDKK